MIAVCLTLLPLLAPVQETPDLEELVERFEARMSGVRLVGSFTDDATPDKAVQEESYTIREMVQVDGNRWKVTAEIAFKEFKFPISMPLDVEWAGDTPVLVVDDRKVPGMGSYSARVVIHGDRYAGLWQGEGHGGHLFGRLEPLEEEPQEVPEEPEETSRGDGNWPSFHGPGGGGVQDGWDTPLEWDVESGENVLWSTDIPGLSHSSPVVWGDRLFVTTAVRLEGESDLRVGLYGDVIPIKDEGVHRLDLYCLDKTTGEILWTRTAFEGVPKILRHPKGSHAASSPATDGERVLAFFGSEGLYCYDFEGELLWQRDLGVLDSGWFMAEKAQWGYAASPVLHGDKVLVQCDHNGDSFLAALDADTGEDLWRTVREDVPTWSTPTVDVREGRAQVICNGFKHIGGYDLETGAELWKLVGGGDIPVPTPVVAGDHVYIMNAHGRMAPIYAIDVMATGEVTMEEDDPYMAWSYSKGGNYMQTPLVVGSYLYGCRDNGIVGCWDLETGEEQFRERIGSGGQGFTSSAVAANGRIYCASEEGEVVVLKAGPTFEVLATNHLGENCMATPAISEGVLYYRTRSRLIALGSQP